MLCNQRQKMTLLLLGFVVGWLMLTTAASRTIKVLKTTDNFDKFEDGSGAHLGNVQDMELMEASLCFRFYFFAKRDTYNVLVRSA